MCTIAAAVGTIGAVGNLMQGQAASAAGRAQAAANDQNARMADEQARDALRRGAYDELRQRRQTSILQGQQRAVLAASGVEIDSGSALDVQEATGLEGEQDAAIIRYNAEREAWGYGVQATNYRNAASAARAEGKSAMTAGIIGAGTSLLSVGQGYSSFLKGKTPTVPGFSNAQQLYGASYSMPVQQIKLTQLKPLSK